MEQKNKITIIVLVGILCGSLLLADNLDSAYALETGSHTLSLTSRQMEVFAVNGINYVIICDTNVGNTLSTIKVLKETAFNTFTQVTSFSLNTNDGTCASTQGKSSISGTSPRYYWFITHNSTTVVNALNRVTVSDTGGISGRVLYSMPTNAHLSNPIVVGGAVYSFCGALTGTNACSFGSSVGGIKGWVISTFPAVGSLTVSVPTSTSPNIDSGVICSGGGDIWSADSIATGKRMRRFSLTTHTWSFTSSTNIGAMYSCSSDGTYVYFANNGDGEINRITISDNTVTSGWKTLTGVTTVRYNSGAGALYAFSTSSSTFYSINTSTASNIYTAPLSGGGTGDNPIRFGANSTIFFLPIGSTTLWSIYDGSTSCETGDCEETDNGGNQTDGRCGNGTALDCVGHGTSPFSGITGGQNATIITARLTNGLGLTNCSTSDDTDSDTCGSGLFMFIFALLLFEGLALALYLGFTSKTGSERSITDISLIMLMVAFATLAIGFYLNWIPDIVFYSIVILVIGLASLGIYGRLRGG